VRSGRLGRVWRTAHWAGRQTDKQAGSRSGNSGVGILLEDQEDRRTATAWTKVTRTGSAAWQGGLGEGEAGTRKGTA
jgi:hypothetical protein